jgi:hypothetical protein
MHTVHVHANMTAKPEQFRDARTDFGPGRREVVR